MLTKFWEGVGTKLADRWLQTSVPALLFWFGGLIAALLAGHESLLVRAGEWVTGRPVAVQAIALVVVLTVIVGSGLLVDRLTLPVLRVVQGQWPWWLAWPARLLISRTARRLARWNDRWVELAAAVDDGRGTPDQRRRVVELEARLRYWPVDERDLTPTRVGNTLRSAETRIDEKYGLDAVRCWPQIWLVLPDDVRNEIADARTALDASVAAIVWAVLGLGWAFVSAWALPVAVLIWLLAGRVWMPARARGVADLIEAAVDVHRPALYRALRWPLPSDPQHERDCGRRLTEYLWRGSDTVEPRFTDGNA